jgi:hypothetical protein
LQSAELSFGGVGLGGTLSALAAFSGMSGTSLTIPNSFGLIDRFCHYSALKTINFRMGNKIRKQYGFENYGNNVNDWTHYFDHLPVHLSVRGHDEMTGEGDYQDDGISSHFLPVISS